MLKRVKAEPGKTRERKKKAIPAPIILNKPLQLQ